MYCGTGRWINDPLHISIVLFVDDPVFAHPPPIGLSQVISVEEVESRISLRPKCRVLRLSSHAVVNLHPNVIVDRHVDVPFDGAAVSAWLLGTLIRPSKWQFRSAIGTGNLNFHDVPYAVTVCSIALGKRAVGKEPWPLQIRAERPDKPGN
jgi:hypothetical protein